MAHFSQVFLGFLVALSALFLIAPDDARWTDVFPILLAFIVVILVKAVVMAALR